MLRWGGQTLLCRGLRELVGTCWDVGTAGHGHMKQPSMSHMQLFSPHPSGNSRMDGDALSHPLFPCPHVSLLPHAV